jgi:putative oxidoreductase
MQQAIYSGPIASEITIPQRLYSAVLRFTGTLAFLAPLATRFLIGYAFFLTGRGKWANFDQTVAFFTDLGIPFAQANAAFVSSLEMVGGLLLIFGVATRLIALLLSSTMVVALLTADRASFIGSIGGDMTEVTPVVFLVFLVWLVLYGAGRFSVDELIARRLLGVNDAREMR